MVLPGVGVAVVMAAAARRESCKAIILVAVAPVPVATPVAEPVAAP